MQRNSVPYPQEQGNTSQSRQIERSGLILPEIVYKARKKLVCIFEENHNSIFLDLQRGQTLGCINSCVVKTEEIGQQLELHKTDLPRVSDAEKAGQKPGVTERSNDAGSNMTPGVTERSNDAGTSKGGAGVGYAEKAGRTPCVIEQRNVADTCIGGASRRDMEKTGSVQQ